MEEVSETTPRINRRISLRGSRDQIMIIGPEPVMAGYGPERESGLQEPPLHDTDSLEALSSNIPANIALGFRCIRSVEA